MGESAVTDYMKYLQTDLNTEIVSLQETLDDVLTRIEECKSTLIDMVRSEKKKTHSLVEHILLMNNDVAELTGRIDAMDVFVSRVHQDMNTLEALLVEAEQDFPDKSGNPITNLLKPILSKVSPEMQNSPSSNLSIGTAANFKKPEVFSTAAFFQKDKKTDE